MLDNTISHIEQTPSTTSLDSPGNFIGGHIDNPFARICCRGRKILPTICDGTCHDCQKKRESYIKIMPAVIKIGNEIVNAGDPDGVTLSLEEANTILHNRLQRISDLKKSYFDRLKRLTIKNGIDEQISLSPTLH